MADMSEVLEDETPVFTQFEAYKLAYAVAHFLVDDPDFEEVTDFIDDSVPKVLQDGEE